MFQEIMAQGVVISGQRDRRRLPRRLVSLMHHHCGGLYVEPPPGGAQSVTPVDVLVHQEETFIEQPHLLGRMLWVVDRAAVLLYDSGVITDITLAALIARQ